MNGYRNSCLLYTSNSSELVDLTRDINIETLYKLVSFDVTNLYTKVPVQVTVEILKNLEKFGSLGPQEINELLYIFLVLI